MATWDVYETFYAFMSGLAASEEGKVQKVELEDKAHKHFKGHLQVHKQKGTWEGKRNIDVVLNDRSGPSIYRQYASAKTQCLNVLNPAWLSLLNVGGSVPSGYQLEELCNKVRLLAWHDDCLKKKKKKG